MRSLRNRPKHRIPATIMGEGHELVAPTSPDHSLMPYSQQGEDMILFNRPDGSSVVRLLGEYGYRPCAKAMHTLIFVAEDRLNIGADDGVPIVREGS